MTAACLGLAVAMWACRGDDSSDGTGGSAGSGGAPAVDAAARDAARDTSADTSVSPDVAANDVSVGDVLATDNSTRETASDARDGSSGDTVLGASDARDASDATPGDSPDDHANDVVVEATSDAPSFVQVEMCLALDSAWGNASDAAGCATTTNNNCPDRVSDGRWGGDFTNAFIFVGNITTDCRIMDIFTGADFGEYLNQILNFNVAFFGCPDPSYSTAPLAFSLIPSNQINHIFTTADLRLLSDYYVQGLIDGRDTHGTFTSGELTQIRAQLDGLAAGVAGTQTSSLYTFSTCADDAGTGGECSPWRPPTGFATLRSSRPPRSCRRWLPSAAARSCFTRTPISAPPTRTASRADRPSPTTFAEQEAVSRCRPRAR
jgi:hypothetical protein